MIRDLFATEVDGLWGRLARAAHGRGELLTSLWSRDGDPRVARLVQAAGYAFARVREKLEDDLPELSHALIATALPEALRATPSATVVQLRDERRTRVVATTLERRTLTARVADGPPCLFETCWPVAVAPIVLAGADVRARESGVHALTVRLEAYPGQSLRSALPSDLRFFVATPDPLHALDVVHAVCTSRAPLRVRALDARGHELAGAELRGGAFRWTALETGAMPLVRGPSDRFASGTALRYFFSFPEVFGFFDLGGLRSIVVPQGAHALELSLRLGNAVAERAMDATFHLGCTPAVNTFAAQTAPLAIRGLGPCGTFTVLDRPPSEILEILDVGIVPDAGPDTSWPVRLWETYRGRPYLDDEIYLRVAKRAALGTEPTELRGVLMRPNGMKGAPAGLLRARVLASDGNRTEALLQGDVGLRSDSMQMTNITRVTRSCPPCLDAQIPWRLNAYARMPVASFGRAASLASYLDLHDPTGARRTIPPGSDPAVAGILSAARTRVKRVVGNEVWLGDQLDLALDDAHFGGAGAAWLVGELTARAVAERADFLRYTRTRLVDPEGSVRCDYGIRQGDRLPPPFG